MRAIALTPGVANSARLLDCAEPAPGDGSILVQTLALGVCGTDRDIVAGHYGTAPAGDAHLILGHESLGVVIDAPAGTGFDKGDHIAGVVRRPDPLPCPACAAGEWDMCRNDLYTERGIKGRHGFGAERFRIEPNFAVRLESALGIVGVLVEPASIAAKAWDHIERVGARSQSWRPRSVLIAGAGPIGLLAALMGVQRGLEVHVLDHASGGLKPQLVGGLGGVYHAPDASRVDIKPDIVIECTGVAPVIVDMLDCIGPSGIVCLVGLPMHPHKTDVDIAERIRRMVLHNQAVVGVVNANRRHYEMAVQALSQADRKWLDALITRRVAPAQWQDALAHRSGDIKTIVEFS
jgi:threonine dehydrogenase-like Zn-dependent dehydrogenase